MTRIDAAQWIAAAGDALGQGFAAIVMVGGLLAFATEPSTSLARMVAFARSGDDAEAFFADRNGRRFIILARRLAREVERAEATNA